MPCDLLRVLCSQFEEFLRALGNVLRFIFGQRRNECFLALIFGPSSANLVKTITVFRLTAVDHHVTKQIKVPRALPNLWVHDDRGIETDHFISRRRTMYL